MESRLIALMALLALGIGLVFAGCGDSEETTSAASAHTQRQIAQQEARKQKQAREQARLRHEARVAARRAAAHRRARAAHRAAIRQAHREAAEARAIAAAEAQEQEEAESSECDPNYAGACLDPYASDYDCEGGSGNGPDYTGTVTVVGVDHYGLDADGDGIGCEDG